MTITSASPLPGYRLKIVFADGAVGEVDLSSLVGRGVFEKVRVTKHGAGEWPGEIDLCPDSLYQRMTG
jgi:hypothetical protein